ncbi:MAG: hypothetical protein IPK79_07855 [Vampirovibrionales bacterium]|nr:hypothetical protein [Vampirovibrionales bacterium]
MAGSISATCQRYLNAAVASERSVTHFETKAPKDKPLSPTEKAGAQAFYDALNNKRLENSETVSSNGRNWRQDNCPGDFDAELNKALRAPEVSAPTGLRIING